MKPQKKRRNGAGWNKDQSQGVKSHFTQPEVRYLIQTFLFEENWHDLALLLVALDTALRAGDLLQLKVGDVCYSDGRLRRKLARRQQKTGKPVEPVLTPSAQRALAQWISLSGKHRDAYLFTRTKRGSNAKPITRVHLSRLIKTWAGWLGHAPDDYACHSLRRSKGVMMYDAGERVADIAKMYGHSSEASTLHYLGITQRRVTEMCLRYDLGVESNHARRHRPVLKRPRVPKPVAHRDPELFCAGAVSGGVGG